MTDELLPTPRALLRRADLGAGPWDGVPATVALAPVLGWLLDVAAPARAAATVDAVAALLGRLAEDRTTVVDLDPTCRRRRRGGRGGRGRSRLLRGGPR